MQRPFESTTWVVATALAGAALVGASCGNTDDSSDLCKGPEILPNQSPVRIGEMYPPSDDVEKRPGDNTRIPVEWTVLLESTCQETLEISEACIVGAEDEGSDGTDARFFEPVEGPTKESLESDEESAIRVTYDRERPNPEDDIDNIAVVVQSNAENFPTLVVPLCARVIEEGEEPEPVPCTSPVEPPPEGEQKTGICEN
jgi:hypothetical protein